MTPEQINGLKQDFINGNYLKYKHDTFPENLFKDIFNI